MFDHKDSSRGEKNENDPWTPCIMADNLPCACQPKVTDFEVARCIQKEVGGLEISMQDVRGVNVLETS